MNSSSQVVRALRNLLHKSRRRAPVQSQCMSVVVPPLRDGRQGVSVPSARPTVYAPWVLVGRLADLGLHLGNVEDHVLGRVVVRLDVVHCDLGRLLGEVWSQQPAGARRRTFDHVHDGRGALSLVSGDATSSDESVTESKATKKKAQKIKVLVVLDTDEGGCGGEKTVNDGFPGRVHVV